MMNTGLDLNKLVKKLYDSNDSEYQKYNGQDFEILREADIESEIDKCVAPMFWIKFINGEECLAYPDEVLTDNSIDSIFTEDFIKEYRPVECFEVETVQTIKNNNLYSCNRFIEELR